MHKTMKLAISFEDEENFAYKDLCRELFRMQSQTAQACNKVISFLYADKQQEFILKDSKQPIPTDKELYGKTKRAYIYDKVKEVMTSSYTGNVAQTASVVESQFKKDIKKGLLSGDVSLSNFRKDRALYFFNKSYKFIETEKGMGVILSLFNKEKTKELNKKDGTVTFLFPKMNPYERSIINKIISGEYKQSAATLSYNEEKRKWMFGMSYEFDVKDFSGTNTLTVRLDSEVLLRLQVENEAEKTIVPMRRYDDIVPGLNELKAMQSKMFELRRSYGNATRVASANNYGKGYRKRADKYLKLRDKEARFRDTFNHKISRYVIEIAKRYDCGLIKLEDFSKKENSAFKNWAYYDLESKIEYKAKEVGIHTLSVSTETSTEEEAEQE